MKFLDDVVLTKAAIAFLRELSERSSNEIDDHVVDVLEALLIAKTHNGKN